MKDNEKINYQIIDTVSGLERITKFLERNKTIAVDLEADSMYHFKEKVCLVQVSTKKTNIVIDPLQAKDLSPLQPIFSSHDIKKVIHGADYDVRSLYRDFNIEIHNLFDTHLASMFLGMKETGLDAILQQRFNVALNKKYQKADWSKRPLPEEMIEYAAMDATYLVSLSEILEKELEKKGRLYWVYEECDILCKMRHASSGGNPLYLKFKGAGRLKPRSLAVLEALLQFRKKVAEKKDKPLYKIVGNDSLMKISTARPFTIRRLKCTKALSGRQISMYGYKLVEIISKVLETPGDALPVYLREKGPVLEPEVPKRIKALKFWRDSKAKELEIVPAIVGNNALISAIAIKNPLHTNDLAAIKLMKNWQKKEFGKEIVAVLRSVK